MNITANYSVNFNYDEFKLMVESLSTNILDEFEFYLVMTDDMALVDINKDEFIKQFLDDYDLFKLYDELSKYIFIEYRNELYHNMEEIFDEYLEENVVKKEK